MVATRRGRRQLRPVALAFDTPPKSPPTSPTKEVEQRDVEPEPEPEPEPESCCSQSVGGLVAAAAEGVAAAEAQAMRRMTRLSLAEGAVADPSPAARRPNRLGLDSLPERLPALRIDTRANSFDAVFGAAAAAQEQPSDPRPEARDAGAEPDAEAVPDALCEEGNQADAELEAESIEAHQAEAEVAWGGEAEPGADGAENHAEHEPGAEAELGAEAAVAYDEMDLDAIEAELDGDTGGSALDLDALAAELAAQQNDLAALAAQLDAAGVAGAPAVPSTPAVPPTVAEYATDAVEESLAATPPPPAMMMSPARPTDIDASPVFELKNVVWLDHPALRTQTKRKKTRRGAGVKFKPYLHRGVDGARPASSRMRRARSKNKQQP
eukprot:COSAG06_NODE_3756_length_4940_cov_2.022309_3_plen_381_part_00